MNKCILPILIVISVIGTTSSTLVAQALSSRSMQQGQAAQYFLGSQDQVLMQVNVWGFVSQPGQYMVPYETDLISLLSYAGGPREEAKIKSIKVVRGAAQNNPGHGEVIEVDVKKYLVNGDQSIIPILKPGDTVVVSGTTFHFMSRFFDFVWRVAVIVQVWALIDY
jgi:polysaccharide export outer membrane protein